MQRAVRPAATGPLPRIAQLCLSASPPLRPRPALPCSGAAVFFYLHMDCLDGKQARRTKNSSPLGQLFDHGGCWGGGGGVGGAGAGAGAGDGAGAGGMGGAAAALGLPALLLQAVVVQAAREQACQAG